MAGTTQLFRWISSSYSGLKPRSQTWLEGNSNGPGTAAGHCSYCCGATHSMLDSYQETYSRNTTGAGSTPKANRPIPKSTTTDYDHCIWRIRCTTTTKTTTPKYDHCIWHIHCTTSTSTTTYNFDTNFWCIRCMTSITNMTYDYATYIWCI